MIKKNIYFFSQLQGMLPKSAKLPFKEKLWHYTETVTFKTSAILKILFHTCITSLHVFLIQNVLLCLVMAERPSQQFFQSCWDGAITFWVPSSTSIMGSLKCFALGHYMTEAGIQPRSACSKVKSPISHHTPKV